MDALPQLDTSPQWIADVALGLRRLGLWPVAEEASAHRIRMKADGCINCRRAC